MTGNWWVQVKKWTSLNELIYLSSTRVLSSVFDTQVIGFKASSILFKDSSKSGFPKKSQNNLSRKKRCLSKIMQFRGGEGGGGGAVYL